VNRARENAENAKAAVDTARENLNAAIANHAGQAGRLTELRRQRDAEDLQAAEMKLREATEHYEALPVPEHDVAKGELTTAKNVEAAVTSELDGIESDIDEARGALKQVGGAVARAP
jgi:hypothetical protein